MDVIVECDCGCPDPAIMRASRADLATWKRVIAQRQIVQLTCKHCGCEYDPTDEGASIGRADVSRPRISSISPAQGSPVGGTVVAIMGHALSVGTLLVRFDGELATGLVVADDENATVCTPPALYTRVRIQAGAGALSPGDVVTGDVSGKSGTIHGFARDQVRVIGLTGALVAGEWLKKTDSDKVQVAASDLYVPCDVTVVNEHGCRQTGGGLVAAFIYRF